MNEQQADQNWRHNALITSGVILAVIMALLMSQIDLLQIILEPTPEIIAGLLPPNNDESNPTTTAVSLSTPTKTPAPTATPSGPGTPTAVPMLIRCGDIPEGWAIHEVTTDDTLLSLSASSGTTTMAIAKANCLQNEFIFEGMIIFLPVSQPTPVPCGPPSWWVRYVVQSGDTLFSLATRTGTTVYAIMQANCLDSTYLTAGRTIYLPRTPYSPPAATATQPPTPTSTWTATPVPPPTQPPATDVPPTSPPQPTATYTLTPPPPATATFTPTPVTPTDTPVSPTDTPVPPTDTPVPPTDTPIPPTDTPVPPTNTPTPTATPVPATDTPTPTATPAPATDTPTPTATPTA